MLGLTRLLVTSSATLGSAAVLLIRLSTLWFGLAIGAIALLLYRSTQHTDILNEQAEKDRSPDGTSLDRPLNQESRPVLHTAATTTSTGERSV